MARKKKTELQVVSTKEDNILLEEKVDGNKIKEELEKYVDEKINKTFIDELDKSNRRLLREKSRKIIVKNIVILILLAIIGFLIYLLFSNNYFDKYFNKNTNESSEKEEKKEEEKKEETKPTATPTPTPKAPTLDELKKEYGSLLDNYYVTDSSSSLVDFYNGNLTDNLKKYITLNTFDFKKLTKEEDYQIIKDNDFKEAYEKLFNDEYNASTFDYDDNKVRYVSMMESYMTSEYLTKEENNIKREITDIKVDGNIVIIETIEGIVKDNKLYEIVNNTEIEDYKGDSLVKYKDKLDKLVYTFKDGKLIKLEK